MKLLYLGVSAGVGLPVKNLFLQSLPKSGFRTLAKPGTAGQALEL